MTRWREDATCDDWGSYHLLEGRRRATGRGRRPISRRAPGRITTRSPSTRIVRVHAPDGALATTLEVLVSAEDDAEVRRVSHHQQRRTPARDRGHVLCRAGPRRPGRRRRAPGLLQAVRRDRIPRRASARILATRRRARRTSRRSGPRIFGGRRGEGVGQSASSRPTARASSAAGVSVRDARRGDRRSRRCRDTTGAVLDPIFALRRRVRIAPGASARIDFWTMVAASREELLDLIDKHHDRSAFDRATTLAWTQAQVQLHHLGIDRGRGARTSSASPGTSSMPTRAAAVVGRASCARRGRSPACGRRASPAICRSSCCASTTSTTSRSCAQLLQAHEYWRMKRLAVDLVILNERAVVLCAGPADRARRPWCAAASRGPDRRSGARAAVFMLRADLIAPSARPAAVRRACRADWRTAAASPISSPRVRGEALAAASAGAAAAPSASRDAPAAARARVLQWPGRLRRGRPRICDDPRPGPSTPAPWINVVANPALRLPGVGRRRRLHLVREQPREPADALVERPGQRSARARRSTSATRTRGDLWSPTALPIRDEPGPMSPATAGATAASSTQRTASRSSCCQYVPLATRSRSRA